jgi:tRNA modification GTPase
MTAPHTDHTIFARASGAGRAGVAVFRISGPRAFEIARALCGKAPNVRRAAVRAVKDPSGALIDRGLVILFRGPCSFTGEDVAEFHLHGSSAVEAAFAEAVATAGGRPAEAGEFTRRALLNGKLDLAQVEALADLIDAETSEQRKQALGQFEGRLSALAEGWRRRLIAVLAPLEADIDFPDEEDVPAAVAARAGPAIDALIAELKSYREGAGAARRLREGVHVAIIGAPNAGKSSLMNALAGSDVAIVTPTPGTTRDIVEARLDLGGIPVIVADTAGLRDQTTDEIEREGMRRALARAGAAHLRVFVVDPGTEGSVVTGLSAPAPGLAEREGSILSPGDVVVFSKKDLGTKPYATAEGVQSFHLSAVTGEGMPAFIAALSDRARELAAGSEGAALTRLRHVQAVEKAIAALERAKSRITGQPELAAEDARLAARALASITGAVDVEDVLGEIFASFCIGK